MRSSVSLVGEEFRRAWRETSAEQWQSYSETQAVCALRHDHAVFVWAAAVCASMFSTNIVRICSR